MRNGDDGRPSEWTTRKIRPSPRPVSPEANVSLELPSGVKNGSRNMLMSGNRKRIRFEDWDWRKYPEKGTG